MSNNSIIVKDINNNIISSDLKEIYSEFKGEINQLPTFNTVVTPGELDDINKLMQLEKVKHMPVEIINPNIPFLSEEEEQLIISSNITSVEVLSERGCTTSILHVDEGSYIPKEEPLDLTNDVCQLTDALGVSHLVEEEQFTDTKNTKELINNLRWLLDELTTHKDIVVLRKLIIRLSKKQRNEIQDALTEASTYPFVKDRIIVLKNKKAGGLVKRVYTTIGKLDDKLLSFGITSTLSSIASLNASVDKTNDNEQTQIKETNE